MGKTIRYEQEVEVIETYGIDYDEQDFLYDCQVHNIENITFDEICGILDGSLPDVMITVTEYYMDDNGNYLHGPHMVSADEFFNRTLCDAAFEYGCDDRDDLEILSRDIKIIAS